MCQITARIEALLSEVKQPDIRQIEAVARAGGKDDGREVLQVRVFGHQILVDVADSPDPVRVDL